MRVLCITAAACVLAACGGHTLTVTEQLCDGGTATFTAESATNQTLDVTQQCGSPATTTILSAPCVNSGSVDGLVATFVLPTSFNPSNGDAILLATACASACYDAGMQCFPTTFYGYYTPAPGASVEVKCSPGFGPGGEATCVADEAFLTISQ